MSATDANRFEISGNLVKDAEYEIKKTKTGEDFPILKFTIAHNIYKGFVDGEHKNEASFFDIEGTGKYMPNLYNSIYLTKGSAVIASGTIVQDRWEQDGLKRSKIKFILRELIPMGKFKSKEARENDPSETPKTKMLSEHFSDNPNKTEDDDIPF